MNGQTPEQQIRRAWLLLLSGFTIFVVLMFFTATSALSYVRDATQERTSTLEAVSGQSLLHLPYGERDWRLVDQRVTLSEGDMVSTGAATAGWITLFDQGTVEISENTIVRINRMRTSRLFRERKEIEIEPIRGTIYLGMAPRGDFDSSVLRVRSGPVTVRMRDEIRADQTGSFLVEAQRVDPTGDESDPLLSVRVAVLRGIAEVETSSGNIALQADQQSIVDASGEFGEITPAVRELVRNGDFSRHLADWIEYHDPGTDDGSVTGSVERVPVEIETDRSVAVQLSRPSDQIDNWETGIQQSIGQTLRVHSSLNLTLTFRIDEQRPLGGGVELTEFPLIAKINYVDVQGQMRSWWHGFYIFEDPQRDVPEDRATFVNRGEWIDINMELRNLVPLPRQISSIELYSSGHGYRTLISSVSLTSSEAGDDEFD